MPVHLLVVGGMRMPARRVIDAVRTIAAVLWLGVAAPVAFADYASAVKAYEAQQYDTAFTAFRELAEIGHPASQRVVGMMYLRGEGTVRSGPKGYAWLKLAADAGDGPAKQVEPEYRDLYADDAASIIAEVHARYGPEHLRESLFPKILPNCEYATRAAPVLVGGSLGNLQFPYQATEKGVEALVLVAFQVAPDGRARTYRIIYGIFPELWRKTLDGAVTQGRWQPAMRDGVAVSAESTILFKFEFADRKSLDYDRADRFVKGMLQKAEAGDAGAQYVYGLLLASHPNYRKPWSEALPWIEKAAAAGIRDAQYQLGYSLINGRGCEPDADKGMQWLERAAQSDMPDAQVTLARLMLERRAKIEVAKPIFWMKRAAATADPEARLDLAAMYAADPDAGVRDPAQALALSTDLLKERPRDPLVLEIHAAALAATGAFPAAADTQQRAIGLAGKRGWDTAPMLQRLDAYRSLRAWTGELVPRSTP
jgi:uncharacterized protein